MMNSFASRDTLTSGNRSYTIFSLTALTARGFNLSRLPFSLKILLENLLRREDGVNVTASDIEFLAKWDAKAEPSREIAYMPARVLMQDFTGVPAVVDLAAMRDAIRTLGGDPERVNPLAPANWSSIIPFRWTSSAPLAPLQPIPCWSSRETASGTHFSSGAKRRFAISVPCRRAWASATR